MQARPYQAESISRILGFAAARRKPLLVAPTGAGKTFMGKEIVSDFVSRGKRVLWLAHRTELVDQAIETLGDMAAGIGRGHMRCRVSPVQVSTIQTLLAGTVHNLPHADLVYIDEAHHIVAQQWKQLADFYEERGAVIAGCTATPQRGDGKPLGDVFNEMHVSATYGELIRDGILIPCRTFNCGKDIDGMATHPFTAYKRYGENRTGFLFCSTEAEATELAEYFTERGVPAKSVSYLTPWAERKQALADLASGKLRILTNVFALTEGVDVPSASICIMARSCGSLPMLVQAVGRVIRAFQDQENAVLIDLFGACEEHLWLPGHELEYSLDGKGLKGTAADVSLSRCEQCWAVYPSQPVCPECGHKRETPAREKPEIHDEELREVFNFEHTPQKAKDKAFDKMVAETVARGRTFDDALRKYKELFGGTPSDVGVAVKKYAFRKWARSWLSKGKTKPDSLSYATARYHQQFQEAPPRQWRNLDL